MDIEYIEKQSKFIASILENNLKAFLQKNPIEKLESIKVVKNDKRPLNQLIIELIEDLKKDKADSDAPDKWESMNETICIEIDIILQRHFQDFLHLIVLQHLLSSSNTPLNKKYKKELMKKYDLTALKMQQSILDIFGKRVFRGEIKRGGSEGFWNERKKLELLALYNRFHIVIKNARRDKKILVRKLKKEGKSNNEITAKREILKKYEIPEKLMLSLFSDDLPREVSLDWAIKKMKVEHLGRSYLQQTILKEAEEIWNHEGIIIDVSFKIGRRIYTVGKNNEAKKEALRYTPVSKPSEVNFGEEDYLSEFSI